MFIASRTLVSGVFGSLAAFSLFPQLAGAATDLPPTISGTPATTATVGTAYSFTPTAKDPEGARLYFGADSVPSWATVDRATGALKGTPKTAGTYSGISIHVWDGNSTVALKTFSITVKAASTSNTAPKLSGTPATSVTLGNTYTFKPTASDAEGNALGFTIANRPSWATFSTSTGQLSGKPTTTGTFSNIVISVSDGKATTKLPAFAIAVKSGTSSTSKDGAVTLSWEAPTANTDGSSISNLSGYRIYYGTSSGVLVKTIQVNNPSISTYVIENLPAATYYFGVRAVTTKGTESALSNVTSTQVQ
jgi:hypothetical protein